MNIQDKINEIYAIVQELQIQPTEHNVTRLAGIMKGLKEVFAGVNFMQGEIDKLNEEKKQREAEHAEPTPGNVVEIAPQNSYHTSEDALDGNEPCAQEGDV